MAIKWQKNKVDENSINNGYEYERKDRVTRESLNAIVNNSLYAAQISGNVAEQLSSLNPEDKIEFKGSNPNLLINGDFSINQRGQTSYTGSNIYCVDRWKLQSSGAFDVSTKTYSTSTRFAAIRQQIEDFERFKGKTITYSVYIKEIASGSFGINVRDGVSTYLKDTLTVGLNTFTVTISGNATQLIFDIQGRTTGTNSIQLEYVKVELGLIATQNTPRLYAENLNICQRYFQLRSSNYTFPSSYLDYTPVMRSDVEKPTTGTLTIDGVTYKYADSEF